MALNKLQLNLLLSRRISAFCNESSILPMRERSEQNINVFLKVNDLSNFGLRLALSTGSAVLSLK